MPRAPRLITAAASLLAACGPQTVRTADAPGAAPSLSAPPGRCEEGKPRDAGRRQVSIVTCTLRWTDGDDKPVEGPAGDELRIAHKASHLVVRDRGRIVARRALHEWTDGWEWGASTSLLALVRGEGTDLAVVVFDTQDTDTNTARVSALRLDTSGLEPVFTDEATTATASTIDDGRAARVELCTYDHTADPDGTHRCPGHGTKRQLELRWDASAARLVVRP